MLKAIFTLSILTCVVCLGYGYAYRDDMVAANMRKTYHSQMQAKRYVLAHNAASYLANHGDIEAYYHLAKLYENGQGVVPNMPRAVAYYKLAATANHPQSQIYLAGLYQRGDGVTQDKQLAAHWYEKAVFNGREDALIPLREVLGLARVPLKYSQATPQTNPKTIPLDMGLR